MKSALGLVALAFCCLQVVYSFDIWEIIEKENEAFSKKKKGLSDDNGERLVGGDIFVTLNDWKENRKALSSPPQHSPSSNPDLLPVFDYHRKYWKRRIPYIIEPSFSFKDRKEIEKSLRTIEQASCLKFYITQSRSEHNWIRFFKGAGCYSGIGRKYYRKSSTDISLGNYCARESIVVHEVLHALGFFHEQSRMDRDSYVRIYLNRVKSSMRSNFDKNEIHQADYQGTPYDYLSIMQYGKTAFKNNGINGNTMEGKFDPNQPLGGPTLSHWDKLELNRRYQCEHEDENGNIVPAITSGWSKWSTYSKCMENWKKVCTKAKYRFCVDSNNCPGANSYGTQEDVIECTPQECAADENAVDGGWSQWSKYAKCSGSCGWGVTQRTRQCNTPTPKGSGRRCTGPNMERALCRKRRCSSNGEVLDTNFDNGFGKWQAVNFVRKSGRASYKLNSAGPEKDHTSQVEGTSQGYYAAGISEEGFYRDNSQKETKSELIGTATQTHQESCVSFYYMLNGEGIKEGDAISIYKKNPDGTYTNSPFRQGGHQKNVWKRAAINFGKVVAGSKIYIEVRYQKYRGSVVAIDDIVFDNNKCPVIPETCQDTEKDCSQKKNQCAFEWRTMIPKCCRTCSDPSLNVLGETCMENPQYAAKCPGWANRKPISECKKNSAFMRKHCCKSCASVPEIPKKTVIDKKPVLTKSSCIDNTKYTSKCPEWAKKAECGKNRWMKTNCCVSCKKHCVDKHDTKKCKTWAENKDNNYCKSEKNKKWMSENCCLSCMNVI